ncbi:glycoside hydrolase family 3 protein [Arthrobacter sp. I2-34]|uniref:beta-N-acetylhexosaminidase n=1 Tax=Arthrobacter hankyongi TaxID=2904801 RepID=A0ABS9L2N2_9MICC|nr:glycoside hydrolase family 3 N-terminal domain-containing protein [Arthrobacter hankyongi]MCG2620905.1 glycoside hydrolase family 3 protein [Arthrobacter hankyongi]
MRRGNRPLAALLAAWCLALGPAAAGLPAGEVPAVVPAASVQAAAVQAAADPGAQLAKLTLEQRVGQVLMAGVPAAGADQSTLATITKYEVGNIFLKGRSSKGTAATRAVLRRLEATVSATTTGGIRRFTATDQEGGYVQVLSGKGFSKMPTALAQGRWPAATIRAKAKAWARQLRSAGVTVNLAPVADVVPQAGAASNAPIGRFEREFGYTAASVATDATAFARGMADGGVAPVLKHFPGLGRVTGNTDTAVGVTDTRTTRTDANLKPFRSGIRAGARWVMVSSAYYRRIDAKRIAAFSPTVLKTMLRKDLGFTGIIVSDDLCDAAQLSPWSYAERAVKFFSAGGTMLLCVNAKAVPAMHKALAAQARKDPAFRAKLNAAALEVLQTKAGQ